MLKNKIKVKKGQRSGNKIIIDGITFKSNLEGNCYIRLKTAGLYGFLKYEAKTFKILDEFKLANDFYFPNLAGNLVIQTKKVLPIHYTPDFYGEFKNYVIIIETKGKANESYPVRIKLFKYFTEVKKMKVLFFEPHNIKQINQSIEIIQKFIKDNSNND